ncbi:MAG: outer membrane beta-barrel protein [Bacteroidota bacterium]
MVKGEANIDIVFRNGLKDYEVLPPQEVWENVHPYIKTKSRSFVLIRAAALIAVLMTLSFFAYRWSREISTELDSALISLNEEAVAPDFSALLDNPVKVTTKANSPLQDYPVSIVENYSDKVIESQNEKGTSPVVALLRETNILSAYNRPLLKGLSLVTLNSSQKNTFEIKETEQQYLPENSTTKNTDRWSVAAMASPTYYSRFGSGNNEISKQLMASEQPLMSYSGGVAFTYKISKRFSVQSGLYYSSLGQEVDGINSFGGFQRYDITKGDRNFEVLTTSGTVYTNNGDVFLISTGPGNRVITAYTNDVFDPEKASLQPLNNTLRQNFRYLELPVVLRYKFIDKKIDFNLIGGLSYNMLVNNSVFTIIDGSKYQIGKTEGLNPISLSSSIGMGMEYSFSEKLSMNLEPTFRYYLNPFNQATGSTIRPYSFGIFSGLSYKF